MPLMNKLVSLATIGSTLVNASLLHRFLSGMTTIIILTIISALIGCILFFGGLCAIYFSLVHFGLDPYIALMFMAFLMAILMVVFVTLTIIQLKHLQNLPYSTRDKPGLPSQVNGLLEAFIDGLREAR